MDIASRATPTNIFSLGPLIAMNHDSGFGLFTGTELMAGETLRAEVMISNIGLHDGKVRLLETNVTTNLAPGEMTLTIDEFNGANNRVYAGDIGGIAETGIPLGEFKSGEERSYRFTVTLAANAKPRKRRGAVAAYEWSPDRMP
jgi:hypothetical protein